ncbi:hypothetical protein D9615_010116 [Tricholomella constricta]|uniref:HD/PDEase domain-containing protein n=1 Tax=Tricholomella constricta TaxID=117010 RepID=A0A8H5GXG4_9AGAR|nr:hypothetical protein D9615_010116 [Tricholomella constricta]
MRGLSQARNILCSKDDVPQSPAMYSMEQEKAVITAAEKFMLETMARYDPSHDAYHVQRVRKTALQIAKNVSPPPDMLVVELAALLHDVLDKKYVSAEDAADPYKFFLPFFESMTSQYGVDFVKDGRGRLITQVIDNVSWSTEKELKMKGLYTKWHAECVELHCVQDADRLDAIGAFGIMRCAAYTSVTNKQAATTCTSLWSNTYLPPSALYAPIGDPKQPNSAIQHFHDKLLNIRDRLKTEHGKRLGTKRHQVLLDFIDAIEEEYIFSESVPPKAD